MEELHSAISACSVSDFEACEKMIKDVIAQYGHLDILVNNAGITRDGLIMKMKEEDFDAVIETNLKGTFNTIRHTTRWMLKQKGGKIINISSVSGILGNAGQANYAASKAGVIGLTKTMARETCKPWNYRQCGCTGICGNGYDRGVTGGCERNFL